MAGCLFRISRPSRRRCRNVGTSCAPETRAGGWVISKWTFRDSSSAGSPSLRRIRPATARRSRFCFSRPARLIPPGVRW